MLRRQPRRDLVVGKLLQLFVAVDDVVADRAGEEERLLEDEPDSLRPLLAASTSGCRARRAARVRRSDRRAAPSAMRSSSCRRRSDRPARRSCPASSENEASLKHRLARHVTELHVIEGEDRSRDVPARPGICGMFDSSASTVGNPVQAGHRQLERRPDRRELAQRQVEAVHVQQKADQQADREGCRSRSDRSCRRGRSSCARL